MEPSTSTQQQAVNNGPEQQISEELKIEEKPLLDEAQKETRPKEVTGGDSDEEKVTSTEKLEPERKSDEAVADDFVVIELTPEERYEKHRLSFFAQMETHLLKQVDKCEYYKQLFKQLDNPTMANQFETYAISSAKSLDILKECLRNNAWLPNYKFEVANFNAVPTNVDVKEKELQISVRTANLNNERPSAEFYVIAEFIFPRPSAESFTGSIQRWLHHVRVEPKDFCSCFGEDSKQLDIIYSNSLVPFNNPESDLKLYDRPFSLYIDKGKSRTLKRKFKPVKLTFYEKSGAFRLDRKLGTIQLRVDDINDEATLSFNQPIMNGRRATSASAIVKVRVREPLVTKTIRSIDEKMLILG